MEKLILITLQFNCTVATPFLFIERYSKVSECDEKVKNMANYFSELSLLEAIFLNYKPSMIAASCVYLANKFNGNNNAWNDVCVYYSGLKKENFRDCARLILNLVKQQKEEFELPSVFRKYATPSYMMVSSVALNIISK